MDDHIVKRFFSDKTNKLKSNLKLTKKSIIDIGKLTEKSIIDIGISKCKYDVNNSIMNEISYFTWISMARFDFSF